MMKPQDRTAAPAEVPGTEAEAAIRRKIARAREEAVAGEDGRREAGAEDGDRGQDSCFTNWYNR